MYLTSVTHRDRLFDLATRWFADRPEPGDGRFATEVLIFESLIWAPTVRAFVSDILRATHPGPTRTRRLGSKDQLRKTLCASRADPSSREQQLFEQFRRRPEEFFPGTPIDLALTTGHDGWPLAMLRIKRVRRIAEKASRRLADSLGGRIRAAARALAAERALEAGSSVEGLVSSPEDMLDDFARAERLVSRAFRDEAPTFTSRDLRIDDVIGVKFVGTPAELARLERAVTGHPLVQAVAREEHRGLYNDVNLLVDLALPPPEAIVDAVRDRDWSFAAGRGLSPAALARDFPGYVESGARTVRTEVILTTPGELIESEFGRSIHEQRILEQRRSVPYSGRIARNASFLVEYLLMLAISPTLEIESLPVKLWGRYLPDVYSLAVWDLFNIRLGHQVVHAFTEAQAREGPEHT